MKSLLILPIALTALSLTGCGKGDSPRSAAVSAANSAPPLEVVNQRMSAYNRHDLAAFLETYADGVKISTYPDKSLGGGKEHLSSIFESMFEEGKVQVTIHHQIEKDSFVINHETVVDGDTSTEYVSIYEVRGGLIQSVCFVRD